MYLVAEQNEAEIQAGLTQKGQVPLDSPTHLRPRLPGSVLAGLRMLCRFRQDCSPTIGKVYLASQKRALAQVLCVGWEMSLLDTLDLQRPACTWPTDGIETHSQISTKWQTCSYPGEWRALKTTAEEPVSLRIFTLKPRRCDRVEDRGNLRTLFIRLNSTTKSRENKV